MFKLNGVNAELNDSLAEMSLENYYRKDKLLKLSQFKDLYNTLDVKETFFSEMENYFLDQNINGPDKRTIQRWLSSDYSLENDKIAKRNSLMVFSFLKHVYLLRILRRLIQKELDSLRYISAQLSTLFFLSKNEDRQLQITYLDQTAMILNAEGNSFEFHELEEPFSIPLIPKNFEKSGLIRESFFTGLIRIKGSDYANFNKKYRGIINPLLVNDSINPEGKSYSLLRIPIQWYKPDFQFIAPKHPLLVLSFENKLQKTNKDDNIQSNSKYVIDHNGFTDKQVGEILTTIYTKKEFKVIYRLVLECFHLNDFFDSTTFGEEFRL